MRSATYRREYGALLEAVGDEPKAHSRRLNVFWPMEGRRHKNGVFLVGRAVNGWGDPYERADFQDADRREALIQAAYEYSGDQSEDCPLSWVRDRWGASPGYNTRRSPFWCVLHDVLSARGNTGDDWPSYAVWSNLYKVSPEQAEGAQGANPSGRLLACQQPLSAELLRLEVEEACPSVVLAITGRWWFEPFAEALGLMRGSSAPAS